MWTVLRLALAAFAAIPIVALGGEESPSLEGALSAGHGSVSPPSLAKRNPAPLPAEASHSVDDVTTITMVETKYTTICPLSSRSLVTSSSTSSSATPLSPPTLAQVAASTNGKSQNSCGPKWLPYANGTQYASAPWGDRTVWNSDATNPAAIPDTGVVRNYDWTLTRSRIAPDGVTRDVILVNGQFPGPALEANWGDIFNITVHNEIYDPEEGTGMHWHGALQTKTPWYDGVPAVDQCPIVPGGSFTYTWQAELYGTSWWHAHYSAQYAAGVAGATTVYGPSQLDYDCDIGPVMLTDWFHVPYFSVVEVVVGSDLTLIPPRADSVLINGRGQFNCSKKSYDIDNEFLGSNITSDIGYRCVDYAPWSSFTFQAGQTHRLRLINHAADGVQKFSIDGLEMTVIAEDYVPVVPYKTDAVTLGVAQRTDVLVTAPQDKTASYWMRTEEVGGDLCGAGTTPWSLAAIYHEQADTSRYPTTTSSVNDTVCANDNLTLSVPEYSIKPSHSNQQQDLAITLETNATGNFEWRLNNQTFRANYNHPILFLAAAGNTSYPHDPEWNVYNFADDDGSVVLNLTNTTPFTHPFHMHGHNFYVLAEGGPGTVWDGQVVNPANPARRDTQLVRGNGWVAIQFEQDNPGVWPFHCHVAWHLSAGLAMNIISRPTEIPDIPDKLLQTCRDWDAYTSRVVVDQIDGGT